MTAACTCLPRFAHALPTHILPALHCHPQVDCVNTAAGYSSYGCIGGSSTDVLRYVKAFRATTEVDYRYTGFTGATCLEPSTSPAAPGSITVGGYQFLAKDRATIQAAVAAGGPVIIYFSVQSSFYRYSGGIYPASSCSGTAINHAMVSANALGTGRGGGACEPSTYTWPNHRTSLAASALQCAQ